MHTIHNDGGTLCKKEDDKESSSIAKIHPLISDFLLCNILWFPVAPSSIYVQGVLRKAITEHKPRQPASPRWSQQLSSVPSYHLSRSKAELPLLLNRSATTILRLSLLNCWTPSSLLGELTQSSSIRGCAGRINNTLTMLVSRKMWMIWKTFSYN